MALDNCPKCNGNKLSCNIKEVENEEYKARIECDSCGYYMRWTYRSFYSKLNAEYEAEDDWNTPNSHFGWM